MKQSNVIVRTPQYYVSVKYETQGNETKTIQSKPMSLKEASKVLSFYQSTGHKATIQKLYPAKEYRYG